MKGIHNADASFSEAVDNLATLPASLKERLVSATGLILNDMAADDLPIGHLRAEYEELEALLTRLPPQLPTDGSIAATVRAMTDFDAQETAGRIVRLSREISEETWRRNQRKAAASTHK
jgi:hypothetical protein